MRGVQTNARWFIKVHRRMIKPPYPVLMSCPACGHKLVEINADVFELSNDFGLPPRELTAKDIWMRLRHSCGAFIVFYYKADK